MKPLVMAHWRFCHESVQLATEAVSRVSQKITQKSQSICKVDTFAGLIKTYSRAMNH